MKEGRHGLEFRREEEMIPFLAKWVEAKDLELKLVSRKMKILRDGTRCLPDLKIIDKNGKTYGYIELKLRYLSEDWPQFYKYSCLGHRLFVAYPTYNFRNPRRQQLRQESTLKAFGQSGIGLLAVSPDGGVRVKMDAIDRETVQYALKLERRFDPHLESYQDDELI